MAAAGCPCNPSAPSAPASNYVPTKIGRTCLPACIYARAYWVQAVTATMALNRGRNPQPPWVPEPAKPLLLTIRTRGCLSWQACEGPSDSILKLLRHPLEVRHVLLGGPYCGVFGAFRLALLLEPTLAVDSGPAAVAGGRYSLAVAGV